MAYDVILSPKAEVSFLSFDLPLQNAVEAQLPESSHAGEAMPLHEVCIKGRRSRRSGPQQLGTLLVAVLARLGVENVESD